MNLLLVPLKFHRRGENLLAGLAFDDQAVFQPHVPVVGPPFGERQLTWLAPLG